MSYGDVHLSRRPSYSQLWQHYGILPDTTKALGDVLEALRERLPCWTPRLVSLAYWYNPGNSALAQELGKRLPASAMDFAWDDRRRVIARGQARDREQVVVLESLVISTSHLTNFIRCLVDDFKLVVTGVVVLFAEESLDLENELAEHVSNPQQVVVGARVSLGRHTAIACRDSRPLEDTSQDDL